MKTVFYDLKRVKIYLILFSLLSFIMISFFWNRDTSNYNIGVFSYYFFGMNYLGMLYIISRLYIDDFQTGAIKNLYVSSGSIGKILIRRICSSMAIGLVFFLLSQVNVIISYTKLGSVFELYKFFKLSVNMMFIYLFVAILIASYVGLIAYVISNCQRAYLVAILPPSLLHYFLPFILFLTQSSMDNYWRKMLEYLPNGLIIQWANMWNITLVQFIALIIWVIIFVILTILITSHKELSN